MRRKHIYIILTILLSFVILENRVFAGGITGDGQYHFLAEDTTFGDSTFFVYDNITVYENGGVMKEKWSPDTSDIWTLKMNYWYSTTDLYSSANVYETLNYCLMRSILYPEWDTLYYEKQGYASLEDKAYAISKAVGPMETTLSLPLLRVDIYNFDSTTMNYPACILLPGYTLGVLESNKEDNGWNNGGAMTASKAFIEKATAGMDGIYGPKSPIVVISYNTHEDYDGKSMNDTTGEYPYGILWDSGAVGNGAIDKALTMLDNMGIILDGSRIVSHSTGHYLAMKIMNKKKVNEYWALSPNTRGSTMINAMVGMLQIYDSWEDMLRDNYRDRPTNDCIRKIRDELTLAPGNSTKSNIMLSHGDAMTGGQGNIEDLAGNMGVLSYSDLRQVNYALGDKRRLFLKYEALDNLKEYDLKNLGDYKITIWDERRSFFDLILSMGLEKMKGEIISTLALGTLTAAFGEGAAVVAVYKTYGTVGSTDEAILNFIKAAKYVAMDAMEHIDLEQRLKILSENYEYMNSYKDKIGMVNPAQDLKTNNNGQFLFCEEGHLGTKISWNKGAGNLNGNTEKYEIVRQIKGDKYKWKVGELAFTTAMNDYNTLEYFDSLECKIKGVEKQGNNNFKIEVEEDLPEEFGLLELVPIFKSPLRYTDGILAGKILVMKEGAAINHAYTIIDNRSDSTNPIDTYKTKGMEILCHVYDSVNIDDEIEKIKTGSKFIIRGLEYEYSVFAWGVASSTPYRDKGVFLSKASDSSDIYIERTTPVEIRNKKIETPWWNKILLLFGCFNAGTPIESAKYRTASIIVSSPPPPNTLTSFSSSGPVLARANGITSSFETTYEWGPWIDLYPTDGVYDGLEEEFETTISTTNLTQGNCVLEIAVSDALGYSTTDTINFVYDTTPPTLDINDSTGKYLYQNAFTKSNSINVYARDALIGLKEIKLTGPNSFESTYSYSGETTTVTAAFSGFPEGYCTVSVYDQAGNNNLRDFTFDSTLPSISNLSPTGSTKSPPSQITGTVTDALSGLDSSSVLVKLGKDLCSEDCVSCHHNANDHKSSDFVLNKCSKCHSRGSKYKNINDCFSCHPDVHFKETYKGITDCVKSGCHTSYHASLGNVVFTNCTNIKCHANTHKINNAPKYTQDIDCLKCHDTSGTTGKKCADFNNCYSCHGSAGTFGNCTTCHTDNYNTTHTVTTYNDSTVCANCHSLAGEETECVNNPQKTNCSGCHPSHNTTKPCIDCHNHYENNNNVISAGNATIDNNGNLTYKLDSVFNVEKNKHGYNYSYLVKAKDLAGNYKIEQKKFVIDLVPPVMLNNFRAKAESQKIILKWDKPQDKDFNSVEIFRSETSPSAGLELFYDSVKAIPNIVTLTIPDSSSVTSFEDTGLTDGKKYFYIGFSRDIRGNYSYGMMVSGIPGRKPKEFVLAIQTGTPWLGSFPYMSYSVLPDYQSEAARVLSFLDAGKIEGDKVSVVYFSNGPVGIKGHEYNFLDTSRQFERSIRWTAKEGLESLEGLSYANSGHIVFPMDTKIVKPKKFEEILKSG